jgi:hypothetical protein
MKYTVEVYGWTLDAKAKAITSEQIEEIKTLKNESGADELSEIKFDIEDIIVPDGDWDILRFSKPFWYLDKTVFVIKDEGDVEVNRFELSTVIHHSELEPYAFGALHILIPGVEFDNILFSVDELKGGICAYEVQSKDIPNVADFSVLDGSIEGPDSEWEFLDTLYHKGTKLEINRYLDSDCKSSDILLI